MSLAILAGGDGVYIVYDVLGRSLPYPSAADILYLASYPVMAASLLLMIRRRDAGRDVTSLIDAAIVTAIAADLVWVFLMQPLEGPGETLLPKLVSSAYPLMDLLLLAVTAGLVFIARDRSRAFVFIVGALCLQMLGDTLYGLGSLHGWYSDGSFVDVILLGSYLLWGAAALEPANLTVTEASAAADRRLTPRSLATLVLLAVAIPGVAIYESTAGTAAVDIVILASTAGAVTILVVARLALLVGRHEQSIRRQAALHGAASALLAAEAGDDVARIAVTAAIALTARKNATARMRYDEAGIDYRGGFGVKEGPEHLESFPFVVQGRSGGEVTVRSTRPLARVAREAIETLVSQVAMALESKALAADLLEHQSAERFRSLVQHSTDLIVVMEADTTIRYATPSARALLGYSPDELAGRRLETLVHHDDMLVLAALVALSHRAGDRITREFRLVRHDGSSCIVEGVFSNLVDDPHVRGVVLTAHDVTERRRLEQQLDHRAFHDELTGLANRALLLDRADHALQRKQRDGEQVALLMIELDDFKAVNDSLGHAIGDQVLTIAARRLRACLRPGDTCARMGGDEFAVLLERARSPRAAAATARRILNALAEPAAILEAVVRIEASIGIALGGGDQTTEAIVRNADFAMHEAKHDGKGRWSIFDPDMHKASRDRARFRAELEHAADEAEFELCYQPIIDLGSGAATGLEALIRWRHPRHGLLLPATFIPLAEATGLIVPIGRWVLREACGQLARWNSDLPTPIGVSVNLSPIQLKGHDFVCEVAAAIEECAIEPGQLTLEITENVLITDREAVVAQLAGIRTLGVRIAIDDFGTGHSSLAYISSLPADSIKIDKHFTDTLATDPDNELMAVIARLGAAVGLTTIAEGIEQPQQLELLKRLGCELGQGYYFSPPLPVGEVAGFLRQHAQARLTADATGRHAATSTS